MARDPSAGPATDPGFDPAAHAGGPPRWFEDLAIGERFPIPSRTLTAAHFSAFQAACGDNHPIHYDVAYCRSHGHPDLLAHGYQVLILGAAGAGRFPFEIGDALIAFLSQDRPLPGARLCRRHALSDAGTGGEDRSPQHRHGDPGADDSESARHDLP